MVFEVLGARMLGPFFGVSLFVWTSLITVTLIALAAGYAIAGSLSDKRSNPSYLYSIVLLAGFFVFLIPIIKGMILKACVPPGTAHRSACKFPSVVRTLALSAWLRVALYHQDSGG